MRRRTTVEKKKKVFDIPTIVICAMFVIPVNFVWDTRAEAQTRTVTNKPSTQSITSSAPPLTPAEAAAIVSRLEHLPPPVIRSEEHTSELQSQSNLVCRLLLEK